ncbi:hypothetical protein [Rosenbergiella epipactidis]|uniref:hypothetical protein n=1 Tax=Rosenbergiella epipactidis TaxID=1544694 RepID=UPI001F4DF4B9|nr:hypothetical protein [Rosenbergiella epipactidis]
MIRRLFFPVRITVWLSGPSPSMRLKPWHYRRARNIVERLNALIMRQPLPLVDARELNNYPWCFVMPENEKSNNSYILGAFLPPVSPDVGVSQLLYVRTSHRRILRQLVSPIGLPFWLARLLLPLLHGGASTLQRKEIHEACHLLSRTRYVQVNGKLSDWLPSQSLLFSQLCCVRCEADEWLNEQHGVRHMPWRNWPCCTASDMSVWLWRQSRFGRMLDSQIIRTGHPIDEVR